MRCKWFINAPRFKNIVLISGQSRKCSYRNELITANQNDLLHIRCQSRQAQVLDSTSANIVGYKFVVRLFDGSQTMLNTIQQPSGKFFIIQLCPYSTMLTVLNGNFESISTKVFHVPIPFLFFSFLFFSFLFSSKINVLTLLNIKMTIH